MKRKTIYFAIISWLATNFAVALFVFASGLLLHRSVLPDRASCSPVNQTANSFSSYTPADGQVCLPSNFKVILLIIDALRYDFVRSRRPNDGNNENGTSFYTDKFTIISKLLDHKPANCKLFKFIADPPTTTSQRIIGLTSGSLPTFIQVGSNFATAEISDDNLIDLLRQRGMNAVFLGDDTWDKIYPSRFVRNYPFDSFNVWDLDTVDNGIVTNLPDELLKEDWHLLVAHFLGVDHCGHRYGPQHPEMERKLVQMNDFLESIIALLHDRTDTLLFVLGDHGMTATGDHGGDTENEVTSALFVYSPVHPLFDVRGPRSMLTDTISQVDLVPTLSSILGLPIPFSNVGSTVLQCIPAPLLDSPQKIVTVLRSNVKQITDYVKAYSLRDSRFEATERDAVLADYRSLDEEMANIILSREHDEEELTDLLDKYDAFMKRVLQMCRRAWVQFGMFYIVIGLIFFSTSSFIGYYFVNEFTLQNIRAAIRRTYFTARDLVISLLFAIAIGSLYLSGISISLVGAAIVFELCSLSAMIWICFRYLHFPTRLKMQFATITSASVSTDITNWFVLFCSICWFLALFSNSYVVEESSIILFFIVSSVWLLLASAASRHRRCLEQPSTPSLTGCLERVIDFGRSRLSCALVVCFALRFTVVFVKCREAEQQPLCKDFVSSKHLETSLLRTLLCILNGFLLISLVVVWQRAKYRTIFPHTSFLCVFLLMLHWVFPRIPYARYTSISWLWESIPAAVFAISVCSLCYLFFAPLVYSQRNRNQSWTSLCYMYDETYANIMIFVAVLNCILSAPIYVVPSILAMITLRFLTVFLNWSLQSQWGGNVAEDSEERDISELSATYMPWSYVILWSMCAHFAFYTSGHYASFSAIQWHAAFLFRKEIGNNLFIPSLLIIGSTFASYFVHGIALPMLLTFSTTKSPMLSLAFRKSIGQYNIFYHRAFLLVSKYIVFSGFRLLFVALSSFLLSRHLMMWKIFAPKFVFEAIIFVVSTVPSSLAAFVFLSKMEDWAESTPSTKKLTR